MILKNISPRQSLNKAFLKVKPNRSDMERFKENLKRLIDRLNDNESEEYHKNLLSDFLKDTYYSPRFFINTKGRNDLVIHNGSDGKSNVGVIIEAKKPGNRSEMISLNSLNAKAFHELILYFLRERITHENKELKQVIITNVQEWFVFDAILFDRLFAQNKNLVRQFTDFEAARLSDTKTDFFYKQIAEPFLAELKQEISFTHFALADYNTILRNDDPADDTKLISLYKLLSPEHILKLPFANDSNSLDKTFYSELLHLIGLDEYKEKGKKLIGRPAVGKRNRGSLLEDTIIQLDSLDKLSRIPKNGHYGQTAQERLFNVALELNITWINRILFLKLLEAQLLAYHKGDRSYAFLNSERIHDFDDLNTLFFQVLARKNEERNEDVKSLFDKVPYLNSSLFEPTELEHNTLFISNLRDEKTIPIHSQTVLKDENGKRLSGEKTTLSYLFAFLDAYDFSSEGSDKIQEDNKTLINASVLGLIFEKINGYKDGSFFTPGFITMYMCRETIRKAVVQKFNDTKGWKTETIDELYDKIEDRNEANAIVNSLKICDPAVGSGHFLVSALNEIIAIKHDLKILQDRNGKRLKEYAVTVENDELIISDEDGQLFEYKQGFAESQRVQETLFHEKQTIIENCLFGVDINPNSVKICRLRLWIELLKNAYYVEADAQKEHGQTRGTPIRYLETLPNIDINIKTGNSLVSRFAMDADLKDALKKSKWNIHSYRAAVATYRNAVSKDQKREMEALISDIKGDFRSEITKNDPKLKRLQKLQGELLRLTTQTSLFERSKKQEQEWEKQVKALSTEIASIEAEIETIKANKIYENAFEWRFEFPEVLNDEGDFVGFDVVIGNPPYIRQEEFTDLKPYLKDNYEIFNSIADLLTYFVEKSYTILKQEGVFQFIISNKFTRANYGKDMRTFLLDKTKLTHFVDLSGIPVFDEATVDAAILGFHKNKLTTSNLFIYANVLKENLDITHFDKNILSIKQDFNQLHLSEQAWAFEDADVIKLKRYIEAQGVPLKDWEITINYGIKTGLNEAFIINGQKKDELIKADPKSEEIIKPLLRGRDIQKYAPEFQDLWLIATFPSKSYDIEEYKAIKEYLASFGKRLEQSGEKGSRKKTTNKWFEIQDNIAYWKEFNKAKIIYPNMTKYLPFAIDLNGEFLHNDKSFHIITDRIFWLLAFLNSKLFEKCFKDNFPELLGGTRELRKVFFDKIPVKQISEDEEKPFKELVTKLLELKAQNDDTTKIEAQLNHLVNAVYGID